MLFELQLMMQHASLWLVILGIDVYLDVWFVSVTYFLFSCLDVILFFSGCYVDYLFIHFQNFDVWPVFIRVDYIPRCVDLAALRGGKYAELVNLVPWKVNFKDFFVDVTCIISLAWVPSTLSIGYLILGARWLNVGTSGSLFLIIKNTRNI